MVAGGWHGEKGACSSVCVPPPPPEQRVYIEWTGAEREKAARPPAAVCGALHSRRRTRTVSVWESERERGRPLVAVGAAGGGCCSTAQTDRRIIFLYSTSFRNSTAASFLCCCFAARPPANPPNSSSSNPFALIIYESAWHFISPIHPALSRRCAPLVPQCALPLCLTPQWRWNFIAALWHNTRKIWYQLGGLISVFWLLWNITRIDWGLKLAK